MLRRFTCLEGVATAGAAVADRRRFVHTTKTRLFVLRESPLA